VKTFVLSPFSRSNSLGRGISMALTAAELGDVELWAVEDGPVWPPSKKFALDVNLFTADTRAGLIDRIGEAARTDGDVLVWVSKGLHPLDLVAEAVAAVPGVTVIQDFDEDDLALMVQHLKGDVRRWLDYPPLHPRGPIRVKRSQARAARAAVATSFTSDAIRNVYAARGTIGGKPAGRIPHTRPYIPADRPPVARERAAADPLTLAFLGSIRPHKGLQWMVRLAEAMPDAKFVTFAASWRPPEHVRDRWTELPADLPIVEAYEGVDLLLVPQDLRSPVAQTQLSAKVIDAAQLGRAVVGSPTATLEEYCAGSYLPVDDWSRVDDIVRRIREADVFSLGRRLRDIYDVEFSPQATAGRLRDLLNRAAVKGSNQA